MLVRMLPSEIENKWAIINHAIVNCLPAVVGSDVAAQMRAINNMKVSLIAGTLQAWLMYEDNKVLAVGITGVAADEIARETSLVIYSLYGYEKITDAQWAEALNTIKKFAKALKCNNICAFTDVDRVREIAANIGGVLKTFIKWEV